MWNTYILYIICIYIYYIYIGNLFHFLSLHFLSLKAPSAIGTLISSFVACYLFLYVCQCVRGLSDCKKKTSVKTEEDKAVVDVVVVVHGGLPRGQVEEGGR